jgi:Ser/Thr protein kinase RdoA (MazF antagonist)
MIATVHSVVDASALGVEIKAHWGLAEPFRCELLTRGMNDVYLVRSRGERYAARVWRAGRQSGPKVTWELEYLRHLKRKAMPVIAAVPNRQGELSFAVEAPEGERQVCLFEWADGWPFADDPKPAMAARIGAAVARMHIEGRDFQAKSPRPIDFAGMIRTLYPALAARLDDRAEDRRFYDRLADAIPRRLEPFERECLPLFLASKEFSFMCGMSHGANYVGHLSFGPPVFDWFAQSVRRHAQKAELV